MDAHDTPDDPDRPLISWLTEHSAHGIVITAASALPGYHWHLCVCGAIKTTRDLQVS